MDKPFKKLYHLQPAKVINLPRVYIRIFANLHMTNNLTYTEVKTFQRFLPNTGDSVIKPTRLDACDHFLSFPSFYWQWENGVPLYYTHGSMSGPRFSFKTFQKVVPSRSHGVITSSRVYPAFISKPLIINTKSKHPLKLFKILYFWCPYKVIILSRVDLYTTDTRLIINTIYLDTSKPFKILFPCEVIKFSRLCKSRLRSGAQIPLIPAWSRYCYHSWSPVIFTDPYHLRSTRCPSRSNFSKVCTLQAIQS